MAYTANLGGNQQLTIANQGTQTVITLFSSSSGQQQSQSSSVITGNWISPPQLYQTGAGWVLQINGDRAQQYISIQATGISAIANPVLNNATTINLENIPDVTTNSPEIKFEPMQTMQPMQPMKPMTMGNMSMSMNPMSMQMGNMSMNMGETPKSNSTNNFCTQCGAKVKPSDRFCANCGNKLQ